jgi:DNA-binding transcriptional regulator GbsR (MarR family)
MVNFRNLKKVAEKAKQTVEERGGTEAIKEDAEELKRIAKEKGSVTDKAKKAAKAVKEPGAGGKQKP